MRTTRAWLAIFIFAVAITVAPATPSGAKAEVLSEVRVHLDEAQRCFDQGTYDMAVAHANTVLVNDALTYSVKFLNVPENQRARAENSLTQALQTWRLSMKDTLKFKRVADDQPSDVQIRFKPDVRMGNEAVAGYASWKRSIDHDDAGTATGKFSADLQIRTMDLTFSPMTMESMRHEIMHEIGHVLGLEDSNQVGNIMGPLDMIHPVEKPRQQEVDAVFSLRAEATRIRHDAKEKFVSATG